MMVEDKEERESNWDLTIAMLRTKGGNLYNAYFRRVFTVNRIEAPGRSTWGQEGGDEI